MCLIVLDDVFNDRFIIQLACIVSIPDVQKNAFITAVFTGQDSVFSKSETQALLEFRAEVIKCIFEAHHAHAAVQGVRRTLPVTCRLSY